MPVLSSLFAITAEAMLLISARPPAPPPSTLHPPSSTLTKKLRRQPQNQPNTGARPTLTPTPSKMSQTTLDETDLARHKDNIVDAVNEVISLRDQLYDYLLSWYDDIQASIATTHGADSFPAQQLAQRRPAPQLIPANRTNQATHQADQDANTPAPPHDPSASASASATSSFSSSTSSSTSSSSSSSNAPPTLTHPSPSPSAIATSLALTIAPDRTHADGPTRLAATRAHTALAHLAAFNLERQRDGDACSVKQNLDRVGRDVRFMDYGSMLLAAQLGEELLHVADRTRRFFDGVAARGAAAAQQQQQDEWGKEMLRRGREALELLEGLTWCVRELPMAVRPEVCVAGDVYFEHDWMNVEHPGGMMVMRMRIRVMRAFRQWREREKWRVAERRVVDLILPEIEDEAARKAIADALHPELCGGERTNTLSRLRNAMQAAIAHGWGELMSPFLNALCGHFNSIKADQDNSMAVQITHKLRDIGEDLHGMDLTSNFFSSMAAVRAQLPKVDELFQILPATQRRLIRRKAENHDLDGVLTILRDHWEGDDLSLDGPVMRGRVYHLFAIYYLSSKATTLEQHFDRTVNYRILHMTRHESIMLARLFCWGSHYVRSDWIHDHSVGEITTALSWMTGLIDAWFTNFQDRKDTYKEYDESGLVDDPAFQAAQLVTTGEIWPEVTRLRNLDNRLNNLGHLSETLAGLPPSLDGALHEPAFQDRTGFEEDASVRWAYAEMRRWVTLPEDRGVLQGGKMVISSAKPEVWCV
ncbi:uncharacterized protein BKCO1_6400044 [Diplodia corticola]|uniref:Uncharacterized protein n=1 Tax=Diplodia corticola TaxID=236234 RepID=A0A1J9RCJ8_9PEZI|nr:uncharacterized protein BKCO1_6400044 [Diplodia corticola]OJD30211.1 hypothetical protein BKCO1_6400044 [Diplodia corticola]